MHIFTLKKHQTTSLRNFTHNIQVLDGTIHYPIPFGLNMLLTPLQLYHICLHLGDSDCPAEHDWDHFICASNIEWPLRRLNTLSVGS